MSSDYDDDTFDSVLANLDIPTISPSTTNSSVSSAKKVKIITTDDSSSTNSQPKPSSSTSGSAVGSNSSSNNKAIKKLPTIQSNTIAVNSKQRGNPILKAITNIPWEFCDDIIPDYIVGATACILYLSLKYHNLNPDYINNRLKELGKMYELRILLVQVDTKEPHNALKHLTRVCFLADLTLMLAWNSDEAGKIIETYKQFENRQPDLIMERSEQYAHQKLISALTNIKPVNKTDAMTLLQMYGNLENLINSTEDRLGECSGLGPRKAKRLYQTFNESFLKE